MGRVSTYLNFQGQTEEAFTFYAGVFETTFAPPMRFGDIPNGPPLSEDEAKQVMNVQLPILGGHVLMGTDMLASMGHHVRVGNNTTIVLETDSRDQADRFFDQLSVGGGESQAMGDMFWGAYWGVCLDRFGIRWMISYTAADEA